ncbi:7-carboxy-7-deazaguanine synthase QueE [Prochlorococcus sp. MIT 1223]|uniref:7-carboxy-7-deazaguanine synthase QueE n=1 Tax=Prochlorococcus sp. MIT 1223 TaxID=3096217 RepID=UPI002A74AAD5|nr:7-carboxy-7-deazaguanine synthase QueE [Prochlorococcus sp. MIT 1223]
MEANLPIVESFHSLQGEGAHTGRSAYFIRLASCKVGCPWCDTKASWSDKKYPRKSVIELSKNASKAHSEGAAFIVITGGEPLHHNLDPLCDIIRKSQTIPIHLETSGVDPLSGQPDWITLSPKKHAPPKLELLKACQELKIIVQEKDDLRFAESIAKQVMSIRDELPFLFLQPGWKNENGQSLAFDYVKRNPAWRMSVQTHKWLNID